jgi:glycolate oxidase
MDAAAQTVSDIIAASIIPCTLEFLDKTTIACVESYARIGLPLDCEATFSWKQTVIQWWYPKRLTRCAKSPKNGCVDVRIAANSTEAKQLTEARRVSLSALARVSPTTILEDITVQEVNLQIWSVSFNEFRINIG